MISGYLILGAFEIFINVFLYGFVLWCSVQGIKSLKKHFYLLIVPICFVLFNIYVHYQQEHTKELEDMFYKENVLLKMDVPNSIEIIYGDYGARYGYRNGQDSDIKCESLCMELLEETRVELVHVTYTQNRKDKTRVFRLAKDKECYMERPKSTEGGQFYGQCLEVEWRNESSALRIYVKNAQPQEYVSSDSYKFIANVGIFITKISLNKEELLGYFAPGRAKFNLVPVWISAVESGFEGAPKLEFGLRGRRGKFRALNKVACAETCILNKTLGLDLDGKIDLGNKPDVSRAEVMIRKALNADDEETRRAAFHFASEYKSYPFIRLFHELSLSGNKDQKRRARKYFNSLSLDLKFGRIEPNHEDKIKQQLKSLGRKVPDRQKK